MNKQVILIALLVYNACGFLIGSVETLGERDNREYDATNRTWKDMSTSGCHYKSLAAFLNPGRVLACEIFRRRFDQEGFGPHK